MKIVIVQSRACFGGAEHVGVMLANGLAEKHEVLLATNVHLDISYAVSDRVKVCSIFPPDSHGASKWFEATRSLRRIFVQEKPDVAIGILSTCSFICKMASVGLHIPVIATEHDAFERPASAPMDRGNIFSKFWLNRIFDVVTVLTEADREIIGRRLRNVVVMPNPLSLIPVTHCDGKMVEEESERIIEKNNIVLAAGRLDAWYCKGFDVLLNAWQKVLAENEMYIKKHGWKLCIAGKDEGGGMDYLQAMLCEKGLENTVEFLGFRSDMKRLYQEASVFVLSSRYEGFGLVLVEAMSQGCACVATDYKGRQKEIFGNSECGMLCQPEDVDALADALKIVVTDSVLRNKLQKNAILRSQEFLPSNIMKRWDKLLDAVVSHKLCDNSIFQ